LDLELFHFLFLFIHYYINFFLFLGHQCPNNISATEVEEHCPEDTPAGEQQVRWRTLDCQRSPGEHHVSKAEKKRQTVGVKELDHDLLD